MYFPSRTGTQREHKQSRGHAGLSLSPDGPHACPSPADSNPAISKTIRHPKRRHQRVPYSLLFPSVIVVVAIVLIPMAVGIYLSFTSLNQYSISNWLSAPFVGLQNYSSALDIHSPFGSTILNSIKASVLFSLCSTLFSVPIGLGAALVFNRELRGRGIMRGIMLLPYVVPVYVSGLLFRLMFTQRSGLVDRTLGAVGIGNGNTLWLQ